MGPPRHTAISPIVNVCGDSFFRHEGGDLCHPTPRVVERHESRAQHVVGVVTARPKTRRMRLRICLAQHATVRT